MQCGELVRALEMMKTHVQRVSPDATLREAVDLMDLYQVSALPVVSEEGTLVGVVTERDVVDSLYTLEGTITPEAFTTWGRAGQRLVGEIMTSPPLFVTEEAEVRVATIQMLEHDLKRIPVVNGSMEVIGVLNRVDVLQALFEGQL